MFRKLEIFDHHSVDEYAVEHYNVKASMLSKHKIYKNIRVEKCND